MWEWGEYKSFDAATGFNHANYVLQASGDYECIMIHTEGPNSHQVVSQHTMQVGGYYHYLSNVDHKLRNT